MIESKEKLQKIQQHLFDELCWRLERNEQFRIKFCFTNKTNKDLFKYIDGAYGIDVIEKDLDKLGKYEDIDEKLGLPYPVFFEAFFNGVDYLDDSGQIIRSTVNIFDLYLTERKKIAFITKYGDKILLFEDYGKTWALYKEELENA